MNGTMVLGICERLSAKSCRSISVVLSKWSWVSVNVFPLSHVDLLSVEWSWVSVNVFPLSHVDQGIYYVGPGPGYL